MAIDGNWRAFSETLLQSAPHALLLVDAGLTVQNLGRLPGKSQSDEDTPRERSLREWLAADFAGYSGLEAAIDRVLQTGATISLPEAEYRDPSGAVFNWIVNVFPCRDHFDRPLALLQIHDVTERDSLWRHLVDSEKMAGLGTLTGFVAHEFNNLIGGVHGFAQLAQLSRKEEDYQRTIEVVYQVTQRVKVLAAELLALSSPNAEKEEIIPVTKLVDSLLVLLDRRFNKQNVTVMKELDSRLMIRVNPIRMQQVLLQVLLSARKGLLSGGELRIRTGLNERGELRFAFEDNGASIPAERLDRLFEIECKGRSPKSENDRAAGAGFAVSRLILHELGGEIAVRERAGGGCVVEVVLPAAIVVN